MKLLSLGASNSSTSINQRLASYAANQVPHANITEFLIRELDLPIYSPEHETDHGIPTDAQRFLDAIQNHDGVVISLAEHNGSYTAAFKNLYDWASRQEQNIWSDTPMLLLSTAPGGRGGATVMAAAQATFPRMGAKLAASFSLPSFYDNFSDTGISDPELSASLQQAIDTFYEILQTP